MRNIIVIGASAGGIDAIKKMLAGLDKSIDAAVCIVQHVAETSNAGAIVAILQKETSLACSVAENGIAIEKGHVYLAPPKHHLLVDGDLLLLTTGAHENKYRPAIDVLFRSAAVNYGHRVIAVILTGMLEDGTSGMSAVKKSGGICIVQNPSDAQFPSMPSSVLHNLAVDYESDLSDIAEIINNILKSPLPPAIPIPNEIQIEADITKRMMSDIDELKRFANRSDFVCPDCGGGLWAVRDDAAHRYRCHTGHVYTEKLLGRLQDEKIEESVWVSIRMLEEKSNLLKVMLHRQNDNDSLRNSYIRRIQDNESHISRLKLLLKGLVGSEAKSKS
jgi:two-component system chemotaxis response regulator CheB